MTGIDKPELQALATIKDRITAKSVGIMELLPFMMNLEPSRFQPP